MTHNNCILIMLYAPPDVNSRGFINFLRSLLFYKSPGQRFSFGL